MFKERGFQEKLNHCYLTQKELANRWRRSEASIINYRKRGKLSSFTLPGSNRPLYLLSEIEEIEDANTKNIKEVRHVKVRELRGKSSIPATTKVEWRI